MEEHLDPKLGIFLMLVHAKQQLTMEEVWKGGGGVPSQAHLES